MSDWMTEPTSDTRRVREPRLQPITVRPRSDAANAVFSDVRARTSLRSRVSELVTAVRERRLH